MHTRTLVITYLIAIVVANLITAQYGAIASVAMSFMLIPFNLTVRDSLHERWQYRNLRTRMLLLILSGSVISAAFSLSVLPVAIASFTAFALAGLVDTVVFARLIRHSRWLRMNGSNSVSALVDSVVFTSLAFGSPILWGIILADYAAKMAGGLLWSSLLVRIDRVNARADFTRA